MSSIGKVQLYVENCNFLPIPIAASCLPVNDCREKFRLLAGLKNKDFRLGTELIELGAASV